jgi:hypothetical protein
MKTEINTDVNWVIVYRGVDYDKEKGSFAVGPFETEEIAKRHIELLLKPEAKHDYAIERLYSFWAES